MKIPLLESLSIPHRIILTIAIVIAVIILLAIVGFFGRRWEAEGQEVPAPTKYERAIFDLERQAVNEAFRDQIAHLFQTWMKDDTGQPTRAINGARQARKAYVGIMDAIERREQGLRR